MKHLVEQLGLVLLVCLGVRVGAALIGPVLPQLGGLVVAMVIIVWLFERWHRGGYR